jgi:hypothetical protein
MPDLAMCEGTGCPRKNECYRHMAIATPERQSYFTTPPVNVETGECPEFWAIEPGRRIRVVKVADERISDTEAVATYVRAADDHVFGDGPDCQVCGLYGPDYAQDDRLPPCKEK